MMNRITRFCVVTLSAGVVVLTQVAAAAPKTPAGAAHMPSPQQRLEMMRKMPQMRADAALPLPHANQAVMWVRSHSERGWRPRSRPSAGARCRERDSNPHAFRADAFETSVSASSTIPAHFSMTIYRFPVGSWA